MSSFLRSLVFGLSLSSLASAQGELAPPPAVESEPVEAPPTATEQELDRAEREDSGRGLEFFWLNAEGGISHLGLHTLSAKDLVDESRTTHTGFVYGGGLGLRMLVWTVGARFRMNQFSKAQFWTLDGEVGMHIPIGALEPYFSVGGGYVSGALDGVKGVNVTGFNVRPAAGLDYYFSNTLALGANLSGDLLFLSRPKVAPEDLGTLDPAVYGKDGSGIGAGVTFTAVVGLHF